MHQSLSDRLQAVVATGLVDEVVVEEYQGQKISDIKRYGVDIFAIGSDWEGKFDYLNNYCKVVYLPRTQGVSSTELRAERMKPVTVGCIGSGYLTDRFIDECTHVAGIDVTNIWPKPNPPAFPLLRAWTPCLTPWIRSTFPLRSKSTASTSRRRRCANCHVLCESPLFLNLKDMDELYALADQRELVLMEALKTRYFPAFDHLKLTLGSGLVGEVKDIDASFSHVFDELDKSDVYQRRLLRYGILHLPSCYFVFGHRDIWTRSSSARSRTTSACGRSATCSIRMRPPR